MNLAMAPAPPQVGPDRRGALVPFSRRPWDGPAALAGTGELRAYPVVR